MFISTNQYPKWDHNTLGEGHRPLNSGKNPKKLRKSQDIDSLQLKGVASSSRMDFFEEEGLKDVSYQLLSINPTTLTNELVARRSIYFLVQTSLYIYFSMLGDGGRRRCQCGAQKNWIQKQTREFIAARECNCAQVHIKNM